MNRKMVWGVITFIFLAVALILGWLVFSEYKTWTSAWGEEDQSFTIEITEGKTARQIADLLKEKDVIDSTTAFLIFADFRGLGDKLKAGEYEVRGNQSPSQILDMLATGSQYYRSLVIPEGFTQLDIAKRCEEMDICTAEGFLERCRFNSIFTFAIAQAPGGGNAAIEGILYPDTYYLFKNTPPVKVVDRMTKKFEAVMQEIVEAAEVKEEKAGGKDTYWWKKDNPEYLQRIFKIVILASIIEKEANKSEDRALIASVFVNRLKKNMPLQADSTVHYAINDWTRALTKSDLQIDSPYNTYKNKGLPAAAICNPGKESIQAAVEPAKTDYLYFIALDGETKFTASYDEFLKLKKQLKR
jgi:peptidoglycan lytic transglycosylase G